MGIHELCQVRKEAALSGRSHVPQGCLGRANCLSNAYGIQSTEGARQLNMIHSTHLFNGDEFFVVLKSLKTSFGKSEIESYLRYNR